MESSCQLSWEEIESTEFLNQDATNLGDICLILFIGYAKENIKSVCD